MGDFPKYKKVSNIGKLTRLLNVENELFVKEYDFWL